MKHILTAATICMAFLLAGENAGAQNNTAALAKSAGDENPVKPIVETGKIILKPQEPAQPAMPALQRSTTTAAKATAAKAPEADFSKDVKALEVNAGTQKGLQPKNIDRARTSTVDPARTAPAATMPQAAPVINN